MVGSDGILTGDMPNPRTYGTFPYILGQFVREEGLLRMEEAVRKMSAIPAQRLGLKAIFGTRKTAVSGMKVGKKPSPGPKSPTSPASGRGD